jgi:hypothetical protein
VPQESSQRFEVPVRHPTQVAAGALNHLPEDAPFHCRGKTQER